MAEEEHNDHTVAHEPDAEVGAWLREAREAKSLTSDAVADALHLDVAIVEALESEAFDQLGATVFAKGHLRAVASFLGLDEQDASRRFELASGIHSGELPELIVQYNKPLRAKQRWPLMVGVGVAVLIVATGLAYALLQWRTQSTVSARPSAAATVTTVGTEQNPRNVDADAAGQASQSGSTATGSASFADKLAAAETVVDTPTQSTTTLPQARPSTASAARATRGLTLTFSDACWFEVRDANNVRLAFGTAQPGTERQIRGTRPLSVTLGVADAVQVRVDGQVFPLEPSMIRRRAARFTVR